MELPEKTLRTGWYWKIRTGSGGWISMEALSSSVAMGLNFLDDHFPYKK